MANPAFHSIPRAPFVSCCSWNFPLVPGRSLQDRSPNNPINPSSGTIPASGELFRVPQSLDTIPGPVPTPHKHFWGGSAVFPKFPKGIRRDWLSDVTLGFLGFFFQLRIPLRVPPQGTFQGHPKGHPEALRPPREAPR